jgi:hypothetical protein
MNAKNSVLFVFISVLGSMAFGHGEDKLGPHGGFIKMPGAFHTEVVPKDSSVNVYLIDMQWKNPSIVDSSVEIEMGKLKKQCVAEMDHFRCDFGPTEDLNKNSVLRVKATREKAVGNWAIYDLPLALVKAKPTKSHH